MLPTFTVDGEWIAADMRYRLGRSVEVGDLVLYKIPLFAHQNGVKRVVGMPGDYVLLGTPGEPGDDQMIQVSRFFYYRYDLLSDKCRYRKGIAGS